MKCEQLRERMPDVAAGLSEATAAESSHLASCISCAEQFKAMQETMALLDEWQVPEPSPYFDVRLQARLREEMAKPQAGWAMRWFRQPVIAAALTVIIGMVLASAFSVIVVYAQELMPGRVGMIAGLFFGVAFGISGIGAAALGALADRTDIYFVYRLCSYLPAIGVLALWLPHVEALTPHLPSGDAASPLPLRPLWGFRPQPHDRLIGTSR